MSVSFAQVWFEVSLLARLNTHLGLATLLVAVPIVYLNFEMALFAIAVTIYGF